MGFTEKTQYELERQNRCRLSQKVCSDLRNVRKYVGDSNVSQLKWSLSAVWSIWDYSLNSFTQCGEPAAER